MDIPALRFWEMVTQNGMCTVIHPQLNQVVFFYFWSARWQLNPRLREGQTVRPKTESGVSEHKTIERALGHDSVLPNREAKRNHCGCSECGELTALGGKSINPTDRQLSWILFGNWGNTTVDVSMQTTQQQSLHSLIFKV